MEMSLLTLNLHGWLEENQMDKFEKIAEFIYKNEIDIIAFQEVNQHKDKELTYDNIRIDNPSLIIKNFLQEKNKAYNFIWDWAHYGYDVYEEGVSVLTKWNIEKSTSKYVSINDDVTMWKSRKAIKATVSKNDKKMNIISCHLGWFGDQEDPFEKQIVNLDKFIKEDEGLTFVLGDFNNPDDSKGYELIKNIGLNDLYQNKDKGHTIIENIAGWEDNKKGLRIDYIFANEKLEVLDSKVIFDKERVSDHFGVMVKVKI